MSVGWSLPSMSGPAKMRLQEAFILALLSGFSTRTGIWKSSTTRSPGLNLRFSTRNPCSCLAVTGLPLRVSCAPVVHEGAGKRSDTWPALLSFTATSTCPSKG